MGDGHRDTGFCVTITIAIGRRFPGFALQKTTLNATEHYILFRYYQRPDHLTDFDIYPIAIHPISSVRRGLNDYLYAG